MRTIEGALFSAFVQAGAVSKDNAEDPNKVRILWQKQAAGSAR
jgi:hypothetical protein